MKKVLPKAVLLLSLMDLIKFIFTWHVVDMDKNNNFFRILKSIKHIKKTSMLNKMIKNREIVKDVIAM